MHINGVGHSRNERILQLYIVLVVPWAGIYVLEPFESSKIHCPGDKKLVYGESVAFLCYKITFGHCCVAVINTC